MDKFIDYDFKRLNVSDLETVEECAFAMIELDKIIASIDLQLTEAMANARDTGIYSDREWFHAARMALKIAKINRASAQERRGALSRREKLERSKGLEKLFIDAAMRILTRDQVKTIWDEVHKSGEILNGEFT